MDKNADADATYWQIECAAASERAERAEAEAAALRAELATHGVTVAGSLRIEIEI